MRTPIRLICQRINATLFDIIHIMFIQKHQPAFLAPHPLITTSKRYTSNLCTRQNRTRNGKYFRPLMLAEKDTQTSTNPKQVAKLSSRLSTLLADVDRGLEFDPDADELDPLEDEVSISDHTKQPYFIYTSESDTFFRID